MKVQDLGKEREQIVTENNKLKKDLKQSQDMLAQCEKKASNLTIELATKTALRKQ